MRIKKFKNNEYVLAENEIWVRNPFSVSEPIDINHLSKNELKLFVDNEYNNTRIYGIQYDDMDNTVLNNVIICSDGYKWKEKQKNLSSVPNKIAKIIGVNGSLSKWDMMGEKVETKRGMSFYLVNNPYSECLGYLPRKSNHYPNLIASTKTNPKFLQEYKEEPIFYKPTNDLLYSSILSGDNYMKLDDYRNPICAAISYAVKKKVKKLALFCCDEAFSEEKPGAVSMKNGLYQYPQQILCQKVIDKQLYWLKKQGIEIVDCSSGIDYENAEYIDEEKLLSFFEDNDD